MSRRLLDALILAALLAAILAVALWADAGPAGEPSSARSEAAP